MDIFYHFVQNYFKLMIEHYILIVNYFITDGQSMSVKTKIILD